MCLPCPQVDLPAPGEKLKPFGWEKRSNISSNPHTRAHSSQQTCYHISLRRQTTQTVPTVNVWDTLSQSALPPHPPTVRNKIRSPPSPPLSAIGDPGPCRFRGDNPVIPPTSGARPWWADDRCSSAAPRCCTEVSSGMQREGRRPLIRLPPLCRCRRRSHDLHPALISLESGKRRL